MFGALRRAATNIFVPQSRRDGPLRVLGRIVSVSTYRVVGIIDDSGAFFQVFFTGKYSKFYDNIFIKIRGHLQFHFFFNVPTLPDYLRFYFVHILISQ